MKTLLVFSLLTAGLAVSARATLPCQLSKDDKAQLAASPAKLVSDQDFDALTQAKKDKLCKSIKTIHLLQNGGKLSAPSDAATLYLGPDYKIIYSSALDDLFRQTMIDKGFGTAIA